MLRVVLVVFLLLFPTSAIAERGLTLFGKQRTFIGVFQEGEQEPGISIETVVVDVGRSEIRYNDGKLKIAMVSCNDKDWECVSDLNLEFSIPRKWSADRTEWQHRGVNYRVLRIHGDGDSSTVIIQQEKSTPQDNMVFIFSPSRGVLGFVQTKKGVDGSIIEVPFYAIE